MPKIDTLLAAARADLIAADVPTPALDARLLLQHVLGFSHADIVADHNHLCTDEQMAQFNVLLQRRLSGEPVTRILGRREFYGRDFATTQHVLDPRPDTETIIDLCLEHCDAQKPCRILDLGTGSGILALTLLAERPKATAVAVDISALALDVAGANARHLGLAGRITFVQGSWFDNVTGTFDLIVSNPPYIPTPVIAGLETEVRDHDPHLALDGGHDGLDAYRTIAATAAMHLAPEGAVVLEIGAGQQPDVEMIFRGGGFTPATHRQDLGGHVRALLLRPSPYPK